ncbi:MAG: efflux RND transporter periplasmic adaptor subunit, partial [Oscillospiraceae bacterium]|nr:efflux RND transporter periplasmic adaptor subunit [Oscillospiraceae bacterium]
MEEIETTTSLDEETTTDEELTEQSDMSSTFSEEADDSDDGDDDSDFNPKKKRKKKILIILAVIVGVIVAAVAVLAITKIVKNRAAKKDMYTDVAVERRTISNTITGSSSIEPNDSYSVMTIKSGEITADYFKEGDTVKKGDALYQFDDEDAKRSLTSAQNALTKAEQNYVDAVKQKDQTVSSNSLSTQSTQNSVTKALNDLEDTKDSYNDQYVTSDIAGTVSEVFVSEGDTVQNGASIATVYNDTYMKIRLPFNDYDAESVYVGAEAEVSITSSGEVLYGTVTEKSSQSMATDSHTMVVYATIQVKNPGALTESDKGSAVVNDVACADTANFEYLNSKTITTKTAGTVEQLNISEGDGVYSGQQVAYIESDSLDSTLRNAEMSYDEAILSLEKQVLNNDTYSQDSNIKSAQLSLEDARISLEKAQDEVADYLIEAPIEGTVITKNAKAGDTLDSSNSTEALCEIYDLSCVKISIDVDETEILLVKVGQKATVTADAVDGEFDAEVITVPVNGTNENGVTVYTIVLQIDEYGDLLPGMNVDAEIVVEETENALTIPVDSVNRGNIVFVKDDGQEHENDVTDFIKNGNSDSEQTGSQNSGNKKSEDGGDEKSENGGEAPSGDNPQSESGGAPIEGSPNPMGDSSADMSMPDMSGSAESGAAASGGLDTSAIPQNIEVPDGYLAILVETGINDTSY